METILLLKDEYVNNDLKRFDTEGRNVELVTVRTLDMTSEQIDQAIPEIT